MLTRACLAAAVVALLFGAVAAPGMAQKGPTGPPLRDKPKNGFGRKTPTPTPTATATASVTATPTATATPDGQLARTGADPLRLALAGLALLGFGLSLRFRIALADARPD